MPAEQHAGDCAEILPLRRRTRIGRYMILARRASGDLVAANSDEEFLRFLLERRHRVDVWDGTVADAGNTEVNQTID